MRLTIDYIRDRFDLYNTRIFSGRLPVPPIEMTDARTFLGKCICRQHIHPDGLRTFSNIKLRFSTSFILTEQAADDVIIHEMIHYFILWAGLIDTSPHGKLFKSLMTTINSAHGRNITISHRIARTASR